MSPTGTSLDRRRVFALVDAVPAIPRFPTVDELVRDAEAIATEFPDVARWRRIGSSRLGEPIHALTIGDGPRHALAFGGVHPNEPIGGLTALHLARTLATDEALRSDLGYTWHIIACIDPDGMRLNEGWFSGDLSRPEYGRQFYRPAPDEQVEWTFPLDYRNLYFDRVLPETLALMRLIDDVEPTFMCSLHNGEFGGVYYYLSHPATELYAELHAVPDHLGIPLDSGEPEVPYVPLLATGIYGELTIAEHYQYAESLGLDPVAVMSGSGASSNSYVARYNTFTLVSELPYWTHPASGDGSPSETPYREVLARRAAGMRELSEVVGGALDAAAPDLHLDTPHLRAMRRFAPHFALLADQEGARAELPENDRPATVAEAFTGPDLVHCFRMRYGGMTLRALEAEIAAGHGTPLIRREHARLLAAYERWSADVLAEPTPRTIPLRDLVGVQYGAILSSAAYAADRYGPRQRG